MDEKGNLTNVDQKFLTKKVELLKSCFKDYEFIGWYSTAKDMKPYQDDV